MNFLTEGIQYIKDEFPRYELYINKYMPMQTYQLIHEAVTNSLRSATTEVRMDAAHVINERASVIYTQMKGVEFDAQGRLSGGIWMTESLMPIRMEHII